MHLSTLLLPLLPLVALATPVVEERTITGYTIRKFTRNCTNTHICTYKFTIDTGEERQPCTVIDETPVLPKQKVKRTGPLATTHAFYGKTCLENNRWEISWGWDYQGDFTVLTVKHVPNKKQAYFGYKSPNVGLPVVSYADVGPNPIANS